MTVGQLLKTMEDNAERAGKETHPARLLLMDMLQMESYELFAMLESSVDDQIAERALKTFDRYTEKGEPIQYILGYEYFAGRNLYVDNGALIPRPETEELVYEVLFKIDAHFPEESYPEIMIADVGTGSGAIAVSLAAEEKRLRMHATDISEEALQVAKKNAAAFTEGIQFYVGDMLEPLIDSARQLDILVSNPPYIPSTEEVQDIVRENEPHVALFGGNDGLYFYNKILSRASVIMKERSLLAFEIGFDQADRLVALAETYFPQAYIHVKKDLQNKDRMLFIENNL